MERSNVRDAVAEALRSRGMEMAANGAWVAKEAARPSAVAALEREADRREAGAERMRTATWEHKRGERKARIDAWLRTLAPDKRREWRAWVTANKASAKEDAWRVVRAETEAALEGRAAPSCVECGRKAGERRVDRCRTCAEIAHAVVVARRERYHAYVTGAEYRDARLKPRFVSPWEFAVEIETREAVERARAREERRLARLDAVYANTCERLGVAPWRA